MDDMSSVLQALESCDVRRYSAVRWPNGVTTTVSAYQTKRGWEVFCWSTERFPGVDFDDVITFPLDDFSKPEDAELCTQVLVDTLMARSKKYALYLYEITLGRLTGMGAVLC